MLGIWLVFFVEWAIFTALNIFYDHDGDYETLWTFNYSQSVLSNVAMTVALIMFAIAYKRIRKLDLNLNSPKNNATLKR